MIQLPSLSSLFGPPSPMRPLGTPMMERPGSFPLPSSSALDLPRIFSLGRERSPSGSTIFLPRPVSRTNTANTVYDYILEKQMSPSAPPVRTMTGPIQPSSRGPHLPKLSRLSRSNSELPGRPPELGGNDTPRTDAHGRPFHNNHHDHHNHQLESQGFREVPEIFRDPRPGSPEPIRQPPLATPGSVVATGFRTISSLTTAEGIPVNKDGLGPKIWTGTHFLPRFVRSADVPGEGPCYFYDDGSHCKTMIDGEAVNAHWGVTKAGKPRKRLAIACLTCREKKIKCDPDFPRCVQCEKFGRSCQFKNA